MPKDETPRQPQAFQADGRDDSLPRQDTGHGAYPEQVFAGESGDPIWEAPGLRLPRFSPEEKAPPSWSTEAVAVASLLVSSRQSSARACCGRPSVAAVANVKPMAAAMRDRM